MNNIDELVKLDDTFVESEFKSKVNSIFIMLFSSISEGNLNRVRHKISDKVYVKYSVDGKNYEEELGELSGSYKEGEKMTIYYNPENPSEITQTTSLVLPIVMIVGGIAAFIGGIVSGANAIKRHKKMKEQEKEWAKNE